MASARKRVPAARAESGGGGFPPAPERAQGRLIGYARVSTDDQSVGAQEPELIAAGCVEIVTETGSGANRARPRLNALLGDIGRGDTLVVVRLDRLARSLSHVIAIVEGLRARGAGLRSLREAIDLTSAQGEFFLHVIGAFAQLERDLIRSRTKAGLDAARAAGRVGGNPRLRHPHEAEAVAAISARRRADYHAAIDRTLPSWLPVVREMRPHARWPEVLAAVNARSPDRTWSLSAFKRAVRVGIERELVDPKVVARPPRPVRNRRALDVVTTLRKSNPAMTIDAIVHFLDRSDIPPIRSERWARSSVRALIRTATRGGQLTVDPDHGGSLDVR